MNNKTQTILFAGLIAAMILPFSSMNYPFDNVPEAFAMQHPRADGKYFHNDADLLTERTTKEATQIVHHNKAMSFNPTFYFESSYSEEFLDRVNSHRNYIFHRHW